MTQERTQCPDCETEMRNIKLIDRTHQNAHAELAYAAGDAERGWFLGRFPEEGRLTAKMCPSCGRVLLYGEPS